jgi:hypothetical protein
MGTLRQYWFLFPVLASLATQCDETPRGAVPTGIATIEVMLESTPAPLPPPADQVAYDACLERMENENNVRAAWLDDPNTPDFDPQRVFLDEVSPNVFRATVPGVPTGVQTTLTVHDINECRRNPIINVIVAGRAADGRVTEGVSANGTPLERVVGADAFLIVVAGDGVISQ